MSLITLGVFDLGRSRSFYEQLGWRGQEVEETVFFQAGGQAIVLWGRDKVRRRRLESSTTEAAASVGSSSPTTSLPVSKSTKS